MFVHAVRAIITIEMYALEALQLQTRAHLFASLFDFAMTILPHRSGLAAAAVLGSGANCLGAETTSQVSVIHARTALNLKH